MATPTLTALLVKKTVPEIYEKGLAIGRFVGLPVSSWQAGDPTRAQFHLEAELLGEWESTVVGFIGSGFLDYSSGVWLKINAQQTYGVEVPEATYATTDVVLTNEEGGVYDEEDLAPGNLTFKNSVTGKTYHNTTGLAPGATLGAAGSDNDTVTITVEADEAGSDSSAAAGEIDEMVTSLLGVTCTNPVAAIGMDEQDPSVTIDQCRTKQGTFSPNGPADAYVHVLRTPATAANASKPNSGLSYVPRVRCYSDTDNGHVRIYIAGPSGAISGTDLDTAEAAVLRHCTPLCITPDLFSASNVVIAVTYQLWLYKRANVTDEAGKELVEDALEQLFAARPIGGDVIPPATVGKFYQSLIQDTIRAVFPGDCFRCLVSLPAVDTELDEGEVAALGVVTGTLHFVVDP